MINFEEDQRQDLNSVNDAKSLSDQVMKLKSFKSFLNLKISGPGEKIICDVSGNKNLNSPYFCAPIIFILGLPACVPAICCIT